MNALALSPLRSVRAYLVSLVGILDELCRRVFLLMIHSSVGHLNDVVHFSGGGTSLIQDNATYTRSRSFYWRDTK